MICNESLNPLTVRKPLINLAFDPAMTSNVGNSKIWVNQKVLFSFDVFH